MSASARGAMEEPGRNVRAKAELNKAILDQGWFEFRRQLEYKELWLGGRVVPIPPQYTSQTCPDCGHVSADNRRSQARFVCKACGYEENADLRRRYEYSGGRACRISLWRDGAVRPLGEAGTRRRVAPCGVAQ